LTQKRYKKGIKISDGAMKELNIQPHDTHPQWNHTIRPRNS